MSRRAAGILTLLGALALRCGGDSGIFESSADEEGGADGSGDEAAPRLDDAAPPLVWDASAETRGAGGDDGGGLLTPSDSGRNTGCDLEAGLSCDDAGLVAEPTCGDGLVNVADEKCDDGNVESGDGCTASCEQIEANFICSTPGKACVSTVECGDSNVRGAEKCDDGNDDDDDGCSSSCTIEPGWACPFPGLPCEANECGDGILAGLEECELDAGETFATKVGCSSDCKIEAGYDCDPSSFACTATVCENADLERGEQCEDGNALPFDGCYQCRLEPDCAGGVCKSVCGDGQRFEDEDCDDGDTRDGDGCSKKCAVETGFSCSDVVSDPPDSITLPVLLRDFVGKDRELAGMAYHEDFNRHGGAGMLGIVEGGLGSDGRPVLSCPSGDCTQNPGYLFIDGGGRRNISTKASFDQWYRDAAGVNITVASEVVLAIQPSGAYLYDSADTSIDGIDFFDPLHDIGWVALGKESQTCVPLRNVSFTTETHFWFEYQGGERFDFSGDDDTWVFVNGKLAVDLGGLHGRLNGFFVLDADTDGAGADTADGTAAVDTDLAAPTVVDLGLAPGGVYEVVMFQAERNECGSNFTVTLKDFARPESECQSDCGDGIVASDELCDDGPDNDGTYGKCGVDCRTRGPYCGDATADTSDGEGCDDGVNASEYGGCASGCVKGPSCGDGIVQSGFEQCDDGKNDGGYAECAKGCVYGARCGDGKVQSKSGEECDDGNRKASDGCSPNCKSDVVK